VRVSLKSLAGISVCSGTAVLLTIFLRDEATVRIAAPAICLQAVIITALYWGRLPALIGAAISGITFALWLFPPVGRLTIHDPSERVVLTIFLLLALAVTRLSPRTIPPGDRTL